MMPDIENTAPEGAIPIDQFQAAPDTAMAKPQESDIPPGAIPIQEFQAGSPEAVYGTPGQQALAGVEAFGKGLVGHTVTALAEKGLSKAGVPGLSPEEQTTREEQLKNVNSMLPGMVEGIGFGSGMFAGTSEAKLIGKVGEMGAGALGLGEAALKAGALARNAEVASLPTRLAAGSVKAGTELAALQADDELSKAINGTSHGIGDAITNIGLSGLLGAGGGALFTGAGATGKGILDAVGLKEFADRLAFRGANAHPNEMIEKEFHDGIAQFHAMNSELTGPQGLKAQALQKIMPKEMTPEITGQIQEIANKAQQSVRKMVDAGVPDRYIQKFVNNLNDLHEVLTDPQATVGKSFDALNTFKQDLQGYSKGNFGPFAVPSYHEAYDFLNITKNLGHDVRMALEDSGTWGKVADLQKQLNASWSKILPAVKDVQGKFMEKAGGEFIPSPQKFQTYINLNGKATTETVRQKMMGNFVDALENHFKATDSAYHAAGLENPFPPPGLGALKASLQKTSIGSKLADAWYDKLGIEGLSHSLGATAGGYLGSMTGHPEGAMTGALLGQKILGPAFGSVIKPLAEKVSNFKAYQGTMNFVKQVAMGNQKLANAAGTLFVSGSKTIPQHFLPEAKQVAGLDEKLKKLQTDQASLLNISGDLHHYLPDQAQHLGATAMNAVNYLNSQRPVSQKLSPLDSEVPPSKSEIADYHRKLEIAEQPLMVLHHLQEGTLLPSDITTLRAIYPEYYQKMSEKIMISIGDHVHNDGTIPYQTRQGLSLFLGQPLDSTLTPQAAMAIQGTFNSKQPQQGPSGSKGSLSKLGKSVAGMQTSLQARESRQNKV